MELCTAAPLAPSHGGGSIVAAVDGMRWRVPTGLTSELTLTCGRYWLKISRCGPLGSFGDPHAT